MLPTEAVDGFGKPVESIMKCEDFKSNFARKLSNRFIARTSVAQKPDAELKLRPADCDTPDENTTVSTKPTHLTQVIACQTGDCAKPPDKPSSNGNSKSTAIKTAEFAALNMDVDTLKWQLAQTEANRQMHLALLKQIVSFLNRIKDHMETPRPEVPRRAPSRPSPRAFPSPELPRSRSVVHMNKSQEYSLSSPRKISARKMSKSISNVNGFKEISELWNQSKLSLVQEADPAPKIIEEIKRLIALANTVISTKIPDLICNNNNVKDFLKTECFMYAKTEFDDSSEVMGKKTSNNSLNDSSFLLDNSNVSLTSNCNGEEDVMEDKVNTAMCIDGPKPFGASDNKAVVNRFDHGSHFVEDESGFSSMSSFQEIGIPIINIIPPTPCKDIMFTDRLMDTIDESGKWKSESLELDKQAVKVFWV